MKNPRRHCEEHLRRSNPESIRGTNLDCFAEPVIGPRLARTRWLAMTECKAATRRNLVSRTRCSVQRCCAEPGPKATRKRS